MTLLSILVFLPSVLSGILIIHLLWPERGWKVIWVKVFLGIGLGLGQASLLDFIYMLLFSKENGFFFFQLALFVCLLIVVVLRERKHLQLTPPRIQLSRLQIILFAGLLIVMILSALSAVNVWAREPHGAWDAWMMYNRAARFIYRDQPGWLGSFSRQMDPIFHADYPLQLGMDIAWAWQAVNQETQRVPIVLSGTLYACLRGIARCFAEPDKESRSGEHKLDPSAWLISHWKRRRIATSRSPLGILFSKHSRIDLFVCLFEKAGLIDLGWLHGWSRGVDKERRQSLCSGYIASFVHRILSSIPLACARMVCAGFGFSVDHRSILQRISCAAQRCAKQWYYTFDPASAGCITTYHDIKVRRRRHPFVWRMGHWHSAHPTRLCSHLQTRSILRPSARLFSNRLDPHPANTRLLWHLFDHAV